MVTYRQVDSSLYLHTRLQEKTLGGARLLTRLGTDTRPGLEGKIGMQDHCTDQLYISTARYYLLLDIYPDLTFDKLSRLALLVCQVASSSNFLPDTGHHGPTHRSRGTSVTSLRNASYCL